LNSGNERLREVTLKIVSRERPLHSLIAETGKLAGLLVERSDFHIEAGRDIASGETRTDNGLAISPTMAALCLREPVRTAAFIRGAAQAIRDKCSVTDRPLRVLYAGCGPYAPLVIPLMSLFPSRMAQYTLLDLHARSLESSRAIVHALGFSGHVSGYVHEDACSYSIPDHQKPDIIISETMNACLDKEPLVAIACRLLDQAPDAVILPSRVGIDACLMDVSKEFRLLESDHVGELPKPRRDRVFLGRVFELNAENARSWASMNVDRLPANRIFIPSPLEERYQAMLLTRVQVYGKIELRDYDSSISCPRPVRGAMPIRGGEVLQFYYRLAQEPALLHDRVSVSGS